METRRGKIAKMALLERSQQQSDCEMSDTESVVTLMAFEDDSDYVVEQKSRSMVANRKRLQTMTSSSMASAKKVERQPTRRPDPNVSNRNALMARENRKRKKELMAQLEHDNENMQRDMQKLQKMFDRQTVIIRGLRNERNYLKSVLANQSDIVTLLKKLQPTEAQQETNNNTRNHAEEQQCEPEEYKGASPNSVYSDYHSLGGLSSPMHDDEHLQSVFDNDLMFSSSTPSMTSNDEFSEWRGAPDDFLNLDFASSTGAAAEEVHVVDKPNGNVTNENIRSEHNYVYPDDSALSHSSSSDETDLDEEDAPRPNRVRLEERSHMSGGKRFKGNCVQCN